MTRKYISLLVLISILILPQATFAESFLSKGHGPNSSEEVAIKTDNNESAQKRNRIDRIKSSINALDVNVSLIEGAIRQTKVRMSGVDQMDKKLVAAQGDISLAEIKLSSSKEMILRARDLAEKIDPTNKEEVTQIRNIITMCSESIKEAINNTRLAVKKLKPLKLLSQETEKDIKTNTKLKK